MRIKLIFENDGGIRKRKLCYLVDKDTCNKVADVLYLIKERFFPSDGNVSLYLDGFFIPPQEGLDVLKEDDIVSIRFTPEIANKTTQDESSDSDSGGDTLPVPSNTSKTLPSLPAKKKNNKKQKTANILPKAAVNIPPKLPIKSVNILKKTVENKSSTRKLPPNFTAISANNRVTASSKVATGVVETRESGSSSSESSDSSDAHDPPTIVNKKVPIKENTVKKNCVKENVTNKNYSVKNPVTVKKTVPISKLGISNHKLHNVSTSSDSSEEETVVKKKISLFPTQTLPKEAVANKRIAKIKTMPNSNNIEGRGKSNTVNVKKAKESSSSGSSGTSDSSSDSSDSGDDSNKSNNNGKMKNIEDHLKHTAGVDFHISKLLNKSSNLSSTPSPGTPSTVNYTKNKNPVAPGGSKVKMMAEQNTLKNKSQLLVSKTFERHAGDTEYSANGFSNDNVFNDSSTKKSNMTYSTSSNASNSANLGGSGKTCRNRRRRHAREENKRKREAEAAKENGTEVKQAPTENGTTCSGVTYFMKNDTESMLGSKYLLPTPQDCSIVSIDNNTMTEIVTKSPSKVYTKLTEPPEVGSIIAYKILEMSTMHYTPEISEYKEACVKGFNKDSNLLELKLSEKTSKKSADTNCERGRFEFPSDFNEDCIVQPQDTVSLPWNQLIEPCLVL